MVCPLCRFPPESDIGANKGLDVARKLLDPLKEEFPWISYSDLWTLAGAVAIEEMGGAAQCFFSFAFPRSLGQRLEGCCLCMTMKFRGIVKISYYLPCLHLWAVGHVMVFSPFFV
jgi:hypothetical protein